MKNELYNMNYDPLSRLHCVDVGYDVFISMGLISRIRVRCYEKDTSGSSANCFVR